MSFRVSHTCVNISPDLGNNQEINKNISKQTFCTERQ